MGFYQRYRTGILTTACTLAATLTASGLWASGYRTGVDLTAQQYATPAKVAVHAGGHDTHINIPAICAESLPKEAHDTIENIADGGPYPYKQDGTVFKNREGILPPEGKEYYHEFTVETPGSSHRGARRIVTGGEEADKVEDYYTDDHYRSFSLIDHNCEGERPAPKPTHEHPEGGDDSRNAPRHPDRIKDPVCVNKLPPEAHDTLSLIWKHGDDSSKFPFPEKDGSVFDDRPSNPLPERKNGYYREYTVITPGLDHRGKLRIVTGGAPDDRIEDYYTDDHYDTFSPIKYDGCAEGLKRSGERASR